MSLTFQMSHGPTFEGTTDFPALHFVRRLVQSIQIRLVYTSNAYTIISEYRRDDDSSDLNISKWAKTYDVSARLGIHNVPFIANGR